MVACALALVLSVAGCGGDTEPDQPVPTVTNATTDSAEADEQAAIDAFTRFWDESVAIANSGDVPQDAFAETAFGAIREAEITERTQEAEQSQRVGEPEFKDQTATITGDRALVVACVNFDEWGFKVGDADPIFPMQGWQMLGRELTRVDGAWLVSGYSPSSTRDECT